MLTTVELDLSKEGLGMFLTNDLPMYPCIVGLKIDYMSCVYLFRHLDFWHTLSCRKQFPSYVLFITRSFLFNRISW